jgi:hypothetical protein
MNEPDMNERFFWDWIEQAWRGTPGGEDLRARILGGCVGDIDTALHPFLDSLGRRLGQLTKGGFVMFAREFERKLFALDREELANCVGLGDDEFLDARGFIVVMGKAHFEDVLADPRAALPEIGVEQAYMTVIRHYETRFKEPFPRFGFRVTTGSNLTGWPKRQARFDHQTQLQTVVDSLLRDLGLSERQRSDSADESIVSIPSLAMTNVREVSAQLDGEQVVVRIPRLGREELGQVFARLGRAILDGSRGPAQERK